MKKTHGKDVMVVTVEESAKSAFKIWDIIRDGMGVEKTAWHAERRSAACSI